MRTETSGKPTKEGTPVLSIVVGDKEQPGLELDLDTLVREGARRMLAQAWWQLPFPVQ
jgi:hypothetical protein